ncbi:ExbD/TolR family protein [Planctomicrobium piriforme]|uniref:Biopolymer transport protein ExbD n=1 Tax=Planctomicrobium piriforme TaxID=1576369 RepID=A0A1I3HGC7_9PLAN|nr:biopolymer transporter ExbD [Planctomicrobium piriforme]SFI34732.1 Biopolymer transport protein ExbD [Planctomicrobium piriforme]
MSSRRRRKKKHEGEEVTLNMAAMLDMAFQLLTFFILTFKPSPIEGQIALNLPPPIAVAQMRPIQQVNQGDSKGPSLPGYGTLVITVHAAENGDLSSLVMGERPLLRGRLRPGDAAALDRELQNIFTLSGGTFDAIQLHIDPKLNYETFLALMDVAARQKTADGKKIEKLSFIELKPK